MVPQVEHLFEFIPTMAETATLEILIDQGLLLYHLPEDEHSFGYYTLTAVGEEYVNAAYQGEQDLNQRLAEDEAQAVAHRTQPLNPPELDRERRVTIRARLTSGNATSVLDEAVVNKAELERRLESLKTDLAEFGIPLEYSIEEVGTQPTVDPDAYYAEKERRHHETLDQIEDEKEVQQFFDENGFEPSEPRADARGGRFWSEDAPDF